MRMIERRRDSNGSRFRGSSVPASGKTPSASSRNHPTHRRRSPQRLARHAHAAIVSWDGSIRRRRMTVKIVWWNMKNPVLTLPLSPSCDERSRCRFSTCEDLHGRLLPQGVAQPAQSEEHRQLFDPRTGPARRHPAPPARHPNTSLARARPRMVGRDEGPPA